MSNIEFLVKQIFTERTKFAKLPSTTEEFDQMFSNKEYEVVLKDILLGVGLLDEEGD